jgi:hypothetical protein
MSGGDSLRRSFQVFHLTLGLAVLYLSVRTAVLAIQGGGGDHSNPHIALLASVEALGAILFLVPRTLRAGGVLLLLTMALAVGVHAMDGQVRADLLVYAAATWFVMAHGAAWGGRRAQHPGTAGDLH